MMAIVLALVVYPGLALTLVLALLFRLIAEDGVLPHFGRVRIASAEALTSIISVLLAAFALALLPWPLHPAATWSWLDAPWLLWALFEGAFLLPVLPGLRAPSPVVARAASRSVQIGVAGRALVWLVIGLGLWQNNLWTSLSAPGHVLLLIAGLLAFPAAAGVGPFGPERFFGVASEDEGLDEQSASLLRFARTARNAALLAALIIAALPLAQMQPVLALAVAVALFIVVALLLRQVALAVPRFTLPSALHWCWTRALPVLVVGVIYLGIVG